MALAYDNSANFNSYPTTSTSRTDSFTVGSGTNRILLVWIGGDTNVALITSITYNGVALTKYNSYTGTAGTMALYYLYAPATGANSLTFNYSSATYSSYTVASYSGVAQSGFPDNVGTVQSGSGSSISATLTPNASGAWGLLGVAAARTASSGTNCTLRGSGVASNNQYGDTNGIISGSTTMTMNESGAASIWAVMFTMAPVATATTNSAFLAFM